MANTVLTFDNGVSSNTEKFHKWRYKDINMNSKTNMVLHNINEMRNHKIEASYDINAVKNSIHNIFTWIKGERILDPEFGADVRKYLYEKINTNNSEKIIGEIKSAIMKYEPRVEIDSISTNLSIPVIEANTTPFQIVYHLKNLPDQQYYYIVM